MITSRPIEVVANPYLPYAFELMILTACGGIQFADD
jgi:hypothetical protein